MKATCIFLVLIAFQLSAAEPPELIKAKEAYQAAAERALTPVKAAYLKELQRLVDYFGRAGKLDEAIAVKNEQAKLTGDASAMIVTPEVAKLRAHFVERTFSTPGGTFFTFNKDGTGEKKWTGGNDAFKWEIVDGKMVKIQGPDKQHFFWFESRFKGEIADAIDGTRRPLNISQ